MARCVALLTAAVLVHSPANAARSCDEWHAEFLSVEGSVEVQRAETAEWTPASQGDLICTGDSVRVLSYGQATVRLPDQTKLSLKSNTSLTFSEPADDTSSWLKLLRGAIHVISRDPRSLRFVTPYANAGLEGTEFLIQVADEQTDVAVLEGEVVVTNPSGQIAIGGGYVATARAAQAPVFTSVPEPLEYSRWASYYPSILDIELPVPDQTPTAAQIGDPDFYVARAARRLNYGRLDTAQADLATALSLAPKNATARALQSVVALSQGDKTTAMMLAKEALDRAPSSAISLLALSYVQQASADLDGALTSLRRAIEAEPRNATAWSRLAEIELANGAFTASLAAATRSAGLRPTLAHAQSVLGFANLSRLDNRRAVEAFSRAIELDQGAPTPHLGLALALIQQNKLAEGREQLETAVILDPANALARSYMAKTYEAEHRSELTATQLQLAKRFDPTDPTPWFYDSVQMRSANRPVEALRNLQTAVDLNDNRPVYRSSFFVDEDLASRSAGLGRLYRDLGFEDLALLQGWKSLAADPTDYSGLRLLADVYSMLPRHQIARVNTLFQSQMLQPINLVPIQPQLAEANLFILDEAGPSELAFGEFSPLLSRNGLKFQGSAVRGAHDTVGEDIVLASLHDRLSYSVGHFRFSTDGFRENNDLDQTITNAFLQFRVNHDTSLQAELRSIETANGDLLMLFDPTRFNSTQRQTEGADSLRLGLRKDISERGTLLASLVAQDVEVAWTTGPGFSASLEGDGYSVDVQHIHTGKRWRVNSGLTYLSQNRFDVIQATFPLPVPPFEVESVTRQRYDFEHTTGYAYGQFAIYDSLTVTLGASADFIRGPQTDEDRINPKIGLIWEPTDRTTLRAAAFSTLHGGLTTSKQNIQPRLEPVQVAGFNQFFFADQGERTKLRGLALDHGFSRSVFAGIEVSHRDRHVPIVVDPVTSRLGEVGVNEDLQRAYVYWTPTTRLSFSTEYWREQFDNGEQAFLEVSDMQIRRLPIEARYFHLSGFSAGLRSSYIRQNGHFEPTLAPPGSPTEFREDQFWVFDAWFGYRLPNRHGVLSLNIDNLLDEDFRFQDADPLNPSLAPERMAYFRFTLAIE
jgi:tetratricopeptide (TPR) repeat protein